MYYKKKKKKRKTIILIIVLLICLILGIVINFIFPNRNLTIFEKAIKDSVITVKKVVTSPIDFMAKKNKERKEKNNIYEKYKQLESDYQTLQLSIGEDEELRKEIKELKEALDINTILSEFTFLNATVIERDLNSWMDTIMIDKGEQSGIEVNMAVVVNDGLIGKVIKTSTFTSTIRLLTSNDLSDKISVKIANGDDYVYGILSGYDNKKDTYKIEGISQNIKIEKGSLVTTTGMGDIFPSGITIGYIVDVETDAFDLSNILEMKSNVNFDNIDYVTILKRNIVK